MAITASEARKNLSRRLPEGLAQATGGARAARPRAVRLVFTAHGWDDYLRWKATDRPTR